MELDNSLELIVGDLLQNFLLMKKIKKELAKKTVAYRPSEKAIYTYKTPYNPQKVEVLTKRGEIVLNPLSDEEILKYYKLANLI